LGAQFSDKFGERFTFTPSCIPKELIQRSLTLEGYEIVWAFAGTILVVHSYSSFAVFIEKDTFCLEIRKIGKASDFRLEISLAG